MQAKKLKTRILASGKFGSSSPPVTVGLYSIIKEKKVNFGVLRISSPENNIEGEVGVMWGVFLIGASVRGRQERGYNAMRLLLSLRSGTYEYIDFGDSYQENLDDGIKIRLTDVISLWPNLPADPTQLGRASHSRMRQVSADESQRSEEAAIDQNVLEQIKRWDNRTMHLRTVTFWSAAALFSSIAMMIGAFNH